MNAPNRLRRIQGLCSAGRRSGRHSVPREKTSYGQGLDSPMRSRPAYIIGSWRHLRSGNGEEHDPAPRQRTREYLSSFAGSSGALGFRSSISRWCRPGVYLFRKGLFGRLRSRPCCRSSPTTLVTCGPYHFTRNPMYVGLAIAYLGEAGILKQVSPVAVLPLVIAYLNWIVIPIEEARLQEVFGEKYQQYRSRVGRWL